MSKTLIEFKKRKRMTIKQLAEYLGISEIYAQYLLSGKRVPSRKLALLISEKTGIPVLNLLYPQGVQDEARD
jgi:transcriptional regulator with XRE-family HTH domain